MKYESDYLGRMQSIVYPDGEVVSYGYDYGGQVISVVGEYEGSSTEYVQDIGYDEYSQRVHIQYGNGTETNYVYDTERRWLSNIETTGAGGIYQNMDYSFDTVGNVLGYTNKTDYYETNQNYEYDDLYQLTGVDGTSVNRPYQITDDYTATYSQTYTFDDLGMGNMMGKSSTSSVTPSKVVGDDLNYSLDYEYDPNYAHRVTRIGERHYQYDANGNVVLERDGKIEESEVQDSQPIIDEGSNVSGTEYGWAIRNPDEDMEGGQGVYERSYTWDERNLLKQSSDQITVQYRYGSDGQRAVKTSMNSETLYFNSMWSWIHNTSAYNTDRESKNIYLGSTRLVTRLNGDGENGNVGTATENTYYYHADHLGSAQLVTNHEGEEYERIEYTPYGETWIEHSTPETASLPYKFTGKELDEETGLYYYGARYLDPKTSRWLSVDPALGEYIPQAGAGSEDLPGVGGIFNQVNFHVYHYAGNNPLKYVDPDGRDIILLVDSSAAFGFGHSGALIGNMTIHLANNML